MNKSIQEGSFSFANDLDSMNPELSNYRNDNVTARMKVPPPIVKLTTLIPAMLGLSASSYGQAIQQEAIEIVSARASAVHEAYNAALAVDGEISNPSRWVGGPDGDANIWLELKTSSIEEIAGVHVFSGYGNSDPVTHFDFEFLDQAGNWIAIPSTHVDNNSSTALRIPFDTTIDVTTDTVRMNIRRTPNNLARIKEIRIWRAGPEGVPEIKHNQFPPETRLEPQIPALYLNQSGFNVGKPKRFTAPTLPDGTIFSIHPSDGGAALFSGTIQQQLGDFSQFEPANRKEYVIKAGDHTSVPFTVSLWQLERISYQNAIDFMIDSRHYVGNYTKKCRGSFGWRDDHHFGWALRTLVPQYLSNPAAYERMPRQVSYQAPIPGLWGGLEPYSPDAPDIVKLIHWGADVTVTRQTTHEFLKGELAYFLYAWPMIQQWLPQQNYDVVRQFVENTWQQSNADKEYPYDASTDHNILALKTAVGSTKGELPPGHSVLPNILMHQVAKRDRLPNAESYFDAAYKQVEWMVNHLDWEDPQITKGQRLSEHITMTGMAAFLQLYPDRVPKGLENKIIAWTAVMLRRSENLWDFRKLTDEGQWTPSGEKRTMWNEVGNVVGFPSILLAAQPFIDTESHRNRMTELVWSHFDNAFGRNPTGRHFSFAAPKEIEGVEYGWYSRYQGGIGQLENARFVLDGSPKHVHYPYHPEKGNYGWTEGWVQFNTAYNLSLAYLARANTDLHLKQEGDALVVRLRAPLNFDITKNEPFTLTIEGPKSVTLEMKELSPESPVHIGRIPLSRIGAQQGDTLSASYGYGYMGAVTSLTLE